MHEFKLWAETTQLLEELKSKHALGTPRSFEVKRRLAYVSIRQHTLALGTPRSFEVKRRLMPVKGPADSGKESANRRASMRSVLHAPSRCAYL